MHECQGSACSLQQSCAFHAPMHHPTALRHTTTHPLFIQGVELTNSPQLQLLQLASAYPQLLQQHLTGTCSRHSLSQGDSEYHMYRSRQPWNSLKRKRHSTALMMITDCRKWICVMSRQRPHLEPEIVPLQDHGCTTSACSLIACCVRLPCVCALPCRDSEREASQQGRCSCGHTWHTWNVWCLTW